MTLFDLLDGVGVVVTALLSASFSRATVQLPYEVTGISPQSNTLAQLLNGFASSGTLYPPLKRTLREPWQNRRVSCVIAAV